MAAVLAPLLRRPQWHVPKTFLPGTRNHVKASPPDARTYDGRFGYGFC